MMGWPWLALRRSANHLTYLVQFSAHVEAQRLQIDLPLRRDHSQLTILALASIKSNPPTYLYVSPTF
jgi:hypothetical protein